MSEPQVWPLPGCDWVIRAGGLDSAAVQTLLQEHLQQMQQWSPRESVHALDLQGLRAPDISFWTLWSEPASRSALIGCVALRWLDQEHAELKSMRTASARQRQGVGTALLRFVLEQALARGHARISLETGAMDGFAPARRLYQRFGFRVCAPFADYRADPNSVFMTLPLRSG